MMNGQVRLTAVPLLFVLALASCGGGGGGDGTTSVTSSNSAGSANRSATAPDNVAGFAYVTNSGSNDISVYAINATTGTLSEIVGSPFAGAVSPYSVTVDPSGKFAYVANGSSFSSGSVSAFNIDATTGALTEVAGSPFATGSFRSSVTVHPSGKFAYVVNGNFQFSPGNVSAFAINPTSGALSEIAGSPFTAGIEAFDVTVDPSGKFAYVANRGSGDVSAYTINGTTGALTAIAGSPFATTGSVQDITVDPSGRFAYVANQGSGEVSGFSINTTTGALSQIAGSPFKTGSTPFSVTVDPSGRFAYAPNYWDGNVSAYTISAATGALTGIDTAVAAGGPFSVTTESSGRFAYVTNSTSGTVSAYTINATTGALASVGAAVPAGTRPTAITTTRTIQ